MSSENLIIYGCAILSFFLSFGGLYWLNLRNENMVATRNTPFALLWPIITGSFLALFLFIRQHTDFLHPFNFANVLSPLIASAVIYFNFRILRSPKIHKLCIALCSLFPFVIFPENFTLFEGISPLYSQIILSLLLFLWTYFYPTINDVDGVLGVQSTGICCGLFIISLIGGIPFLLGGYALSLGAICLAFLFFNWYPAQLTLLPAGGNALGFILGWLLINACYEESGPAVIIISFFFWVEWITSLINYATNRKKGKTIGQNTTCYKTYLSGNSQHAISVHIFKLEAILIMLAVFELYAPNNYTLPIFSFIVTLWSLSKLKNWQTPEKNLHELNKDFVADIKSNINSIKKTFNKEK